MKIYTYYENINFSYQNELIELWKISWSRQGYEPIILNRDDAKKFEHYNKYYDFIQEIHEKSTGSVLPDVSYHMAAQLEIAAFATIKEPSFISDYDIINVNFKPCNVGSKVFWRDAACTCFASGDSLGWCNYINFLFSNKNKIIEHCKDIKGRFRFHDQDFLIPIYDSGILSGAFDGHRTKFTCKEWLPDNPDNKQMKLYHISHSNIENLKTKYPQYSNLNSNKLRVDVVKMLLNDHIS